MTRIPQFNAGVPQNYLSRYNHHIMAKSTPVTRALDELGIPYQIHTHERPLRSLEQAAEERGLEPDQIARSLLFRLEDGAFVLVLMPGGGKSELGQAAKASRDFPYDHSHQRGSPRSHRIRYGGRLNFRQRSPAQVFDNAT